MFTGLVEEIGIVENVKWGSKSARIKIKASKVLEDVKIGDSISTNGVCLTVTEFNKDSFTVDVMAETMRKTSLNMVKNGIKVNLERAMKLGDRFGGHLVSGHIDGVGVIKDIQREDNAVWIHISAGNDLLKLIVEKGSIAVDGVSLTAGYVDNDSFKVSIIPHTQEETTLTNKKTGEKVNLECDVIGKYVEKLLHINNRQNNAAKNESKIDMNFLKVNGFI